MLHVASTDCSLCFVLLSLFRTTGYHLIFRTNFRSVCCAILHYYLAHSGLTVFCIVSLSFVLSSFWQFDPLDNKLLSNLYHIISICWFALSLAVSTRSKMSLYGLFI
jgi:hypothetical protein